MFSATNHKTITFYKFLDVKNPHDLKGFIRGLCVSLNLKGRVLLGKEGINGGVSGESVDIEKFKTLLKKQKHLEDLTFREIDVEKNSYHKLVVKVRDEIVALGVKVDMNKKANYVSPQKLNEWIEKDKELVIVDARNNYEAKVGKFKNAVLLDIENFRELPEAIEKFDNLKDKKIVTYCTGGIRCEKVSAYMKEKGFKNVFQLKGGIIEYTNQFPGKYFEGKCFVFDDRLTDETGSSTVLSKCGICGSPADKYTDCYNMECDKLFVCCDECRIKMNNTCSIECKNSSKIRPVEKQFNIV